MVKLIVLSGGNGVNKTKDNIQWQKIINFFEHL